MGKKKYYRGCSSSSSSSSSDDGLKLRHNPAKLAKRQFKLQRKMYKKGRCVCGFCPMGTMACDQNFLKRYSSHQPYYGMSTHPNMASSSHRFGIPANYPQVNTGHYPQGPIGPYPQANIGPYPQANAGSYPQPNAGPYPQPNAGPYPQPNAGPYPQQNTGPYPQQNVGPYSQINTGPYPQANAGGFMPPSGYGSGAPYGSNVPGYHNQYTEGPSSKVPTGMPPLPANPQSIVSQYPPGPNP